MFAVSLPNPGSRAALVYKKHTAHTCVRANVVENFVKLIKQNIMSDFEFDSDSDQEISENHSKLLEAVRQLDKSQRVRKPERSEPSLEVSEFHLVKSGITDQNAVEIKDLARTLGKKGHHAEISKKINATKSRSKVLPKPLEKPAAERIKRTVGFENTKKELGKWAAIISRNRTAASVSFPLSQSSMKLEPTEGYLKRFRLQSELEKKLAELEPEKEPEEEKDEFPLTLQEILERRRDAAKLRAQQSYKVAKAHRQRKIKSKKFHRVQRKERIKKALKEFEELQKTDPQAALEKLEELDKTRAEERMTLRHKSTGQWAKSRQVRAKYDKESRQVLAQQLSISRELTQKVKKDEDSEEENDDQDQPMHLPNSDKENPWMNPIKNESEIEQFISGYRKYWDKQNKSTNESKTNENGNKKDKNGVPKDNKIFEESKIKDLPPDQNPVEEVIEECLREQNGLNEDNDSDKSESEEKNNHKNNSSVQKKKLQKMLKDKLGIKLPKSKATKIKNIKVKAGTSNWSITPVRTENDASNSKDIDIDELSDSAEDKIQEKIKEKLAKVKLMLHEATKRRGRKNQRKTKGDTLDDVDKLGLKGQKHIKPIIDKPIEEVASSRPSDENTETQFTNITDFNKHVTSKTKTPEIDPNKFMNMKPKHIKTVLPDEVGGEEEALDDDEAEEDQHQIISEAFADDDVVDEFRKEKEEEIKNSQPEDVDLRLPGWGSWGGKNIKPSSRKKRRFIMKFPKVEPRRDENKGDVVIIEEKCPKIKRHLVSDLPFPFTSVEDYEASMRAPLGRDFVPEKTFCKLMTPAVKTKMGKVIEPMSEDVLVKTENMKKRKKPANETKGAGQTKKRKGNNRRKRNNRESLKKRGQEIAENNK